MRSTVAIIVFLALHNIGSAQLLSSIDERPDIPVKFEPAAKVPADLALKTTLTFVDFSVIFDGGSYGARFRRDNGRRLVILFPHPGYWTKEAIKKKTQPIAVLDESEEEQMNLEIKPGSPFEKRIVELLTDDLSNKEHSRKQIRTLKRIRDSIRSRKPLLELRQRFPDAFKG